MITNKVIVGGGRLVANQQSEHSAIFFWRVTDGNQ